MAAMLIGDLAARAATPAPTIRYYESIGLLRRPPRTAGGYRRYPESALAELRFIRKAQALGFNLDEVREILGLSRAGQKPCDRVLALSRQHLAVVDDRISALQQFREYLSAELLRWDREGIAVTGDGLCRFIAESDAAAPPSPHRAPGRKRAWP